MQYVFRIKSGSNTELSKGAALPASRHLRPNFNNINHYNNEDNDDINVDDDNIKRAVSADDLTGNFDRDSGKEGSLDPSNCDPGGQFNSFKSLIGLLFTPFFGPFFKIAYRNALLAN